MSGRISVDGTRYVPRKDPGKHPGASKQARQRAKARAKAQARDGREAGLPLTDSHRQLIDQARSDLRELSMAATRAARGGRRDEHARLLTRRDEVRVLLRRLLARAEELAEAVASAPAEEVSMEMVRLMTARPRGGLARNAIRAQPDRAEPWPSSARR